VENGRNKQSLVPHKSRNLGPVRHPRNGAGRLSDGEDGIAEIETDGRGRENGMKEEE
jgi:hypothetical protein